MKEAWLGGVGVVKKNMTPHSNRIKIFRIKGARERDGSKEWKCL